jgi:hypothetical protein
MSDSSQCFFSQVRGQSVEQGLCKSRRQQFERRSVPSYTQAIAMETPREPKTTWKQVEGGYRSYRYANNFFSKVDVRFFIDEKKVLFNVQGADTSSIKGVIDFGLTKRATKRLKEYLEVSL